MRDEVEAIYEEALIERSLNGQFESLVGIIRDVAETNRVRIRADAVLFLARNFEELIITPANIASQRNIIPSENLSRWVMRDIRFIIHNISEESREGSDKEISSTLVLKFIGRNIENLWIMQMALWGDEEGPKYESR
ncbi:MAG: hypothetical protein H2040_04395 [Euryhalocaulis sp.]|uniref:hypothetical protein n=1 Tax=Euryhalocaulis sp. TaxID=2744307 RepID=UPI001794F9E8|nr:hypothetical protein [Euryhalocaulis sp.]MBA4801079.1 hypothetical protein [Euryhalocaulis sp.]